MSEIGVIRLSPSSEVIFYIDMYKGERFANIRKFIRSERYTGPTKKGIKLTKQQLEPIIKALTKLSGDLDTIQEEELASIPISEDRHISIRINYFNGAYGLDIRHYISNKKYKGPLKKGIRIPLEHTKDVSAYCQKMLDKFEIPEAKDTLFGRQDEAPKKKTPKKKISSKKNKTIEGIPDEFQKYFE